MEINDKNTIKVIHEILSKRVGSELRDMHEAYGIPQEILSRIAVTLYATDEGMRAWKGGKTKFVKIFEKECRMLLKSKRINFNELGFLTFLAITFTNYEDNVLRMREDGRACTQKDIIEESGRTRSSISPMMKSLVAKKILFEKKSPNTPNGKSYFINPMLFYRGNKIDSRQKDIMDKIKEDIYTVWKSKEKTDILVEENKVAIDSAINEIITSEKEIMDEFYRLAMGYDNGSLEDGVREEELEENAV